MDTLLKRFAKIADAFAAKRAYFHQRMVVYQKRGSSKLALQCGDLLNKADMLLEQLKQGVATQPELRDDAYLAKLTKDFKRTYQELIALTKPWWREWIEAIGTALILAFFLRNFVFGLYHVPSGSAEPNLLVGDRLWGNKLVYFFQPVRHGDLVIIDNPEFPYAPQGTLQYWWQRLIGMPIPLLGLQAGPDSWVKRVIAVPGDMIEGRVEADGTTAIYVNGKKLDEPYVNSYPLVMLKRTYGFIDADWFGPLPVPSFLRWGVKKFPYTYDPSVPYDKQPFYKFQADQLLLGRDGKPQLLQPGTPNYDQSWLGELGGKRMTRDAFGSYKLAPGKYWAMGDSRKNSKDSRFWGTLDESLILGRASFIIWSLDSEESFWLFDLIKHPIDFFTKNIRWSRFFVSLGMYNGRPDLDDKNEKLKNLK